MTRNAGFATCGLLLVASGAVAQDRLQSADLLKLRSVSAVQVSPEHFDGALLSLLTDPVRRARLGAAARALVEANRGAKEKTLAVIAEIAPVDASRGVVRPFRLVN